MQEKAYDRSYMSARTTVVHGNASRGCQGLSPEQSARPGCSDSPTIVSQPLLPCRRTTLAYNTATFRTPPAVER